MTGETNDIIYYLNEADEVVTVNSAWNRFARENGAHAALGPRVQWRPLWAFIADDVTALLCRRLIRSARDGRTIDFCMRCDGPGVVRLARTRMRRQHMGLLEICVRIIGEVQRRAIPIVTARGCIEGGTHWCSWCQRIEIEPGIWIEAEDAYHEISELDWTRPLLVRPGSCPRCVERMLSIAESSGDSAPSVPAELWPPQPLRTMVWRGLPPHRHLAGAG